jgi:hypothetical protein
MDQITEQMCGASARSSLDSNPRPETDSLSGADRRFRAEAAQLTPQIVTLQQQFCNSKSRVIR